MYRCKSKQSSSHGDWMLGHAMKLRDGGRRATVAELQAWAMAGLWKPV
jgi:hypothetical protein